jgi:hypothetical protein
VDPRAAEGDDDAEQAALGCGRMLQQRGADRDEADGRGALVLGEEGELTRDLGAGSEGDLRLGGAVRQRDQDDAVGRARIAGAGEIGLAAFEEGEVDREDLLFRGRGREHDASIPSRGPSVISGCVIGGG